MVVATLRRLAASKYGLALKIVVSLGILIGFAVVVDGRRLLELLASVRYEYLLLLALISLFRIWISAFRFRRLVGPAQDLPMPLLVRQYFVAAYFNNILPTALGGDFVRLFMLAEQGMSKQVGAVLIVAERLSGSAALLILATVGVLTFDVQPELRWLVLGGTGLAAVSALAFYAARGRVEAMAARRPGLARAARAVALLAGRPGLLLQVLAISLVFQLASISISWVVARALSLEVSFLACVALVPLVWLVTLLPISLGGIGLREASFAYLFGTIGLSTEASLLISLGTFASLVFNGAIGGLLMAGSHLRKGMAGYTPGDD